MKDVELDLPKEDIIAIELILIQVNNFMEYKLFSANLYTKRKKYEKAGVQGLVVNLFSPILKILDIEASPVDLFLHFTKQVMVIEYPNKSGLTIRDMMYENAEIYIYWLKESKGDITINYKPNHILDV